MKCKWPVNGGPETLFQQVVDCIHQVDVACCQIYYILILAPKKRIVLPVLGEVRFQYPDARHHTSGNETEVGPVAPVSHLFGLCAYSRNKRQIMARMATVQIVQSSVYVFRVYQLGIRTMEQVVRNTRLNNVSVTCPSGSADPYSIRIFFVYFGKFSGIASTKGLTCFLNALSMKGIICAMTEAFRLNCSKRVGSSSFILVL